MSNEHDTAEGLLREFASLNLGTSDAKRFYELRDRTRAYLDRDQGAWRPISEAPIQIPISEAKFLLGDARKAGINTKDSRAVVEWAANEAEKQAAAWSARAQGMMSVLGAIPAPLDPVPTVQAVQEGKARTAEAVTQLGPRRVCGCEWPDMRPDEKCGTCGKPIGGDNDLSVGSNGG